MMEHQAPQTVRFVVLRHEGIPDPHFDLLFDLTSGNDLATWRSPNWPISQPMTLVRLKDHRRIYLEYEGPISKNRGFVKRIASGTCQFIQTADASHISVQNMSRLSGLVSDFTMTRAQGDAWQASPTPGTSDLLLRHPS
jgi:hypothetical protein